MTRMSSMAQDCSCSSNSTNSFGLHSPSGRQPFVLCSAPHRRPEPGEVCECGSQSVSGGVNDDMLESRRVGQQRHGSPAFPRPGRVISQRGASLTRSSRGEHKHQNTHTHRCERQRADGAACLVLIHLCLPN